MILARRKNGVAPCLTRPYNLYTTFNDLSHVVHIFESGERRVESDV